MDNENRPKGKTTQLIEKAVELLGEMPEDHCVFVTGAHYRWLVDLEGMFRRSGLVGVKFYLPHEIIYNGVLRGRKGVLLIDDEYELSYIERAMIIEEKKLLEAKNL